MLRPGEPTLTGCALRATLRLLDVRTVLAVLRLEKLEAGVPSADWVIPIGVRVYCKALERYQARSDGQDPPPYSQEEIEELRRQDIETVEGQGFTAELHDSPGGRSGEGREMLAEWREDARRRLARAAELGDQWRRAYEDDENDEEEEYEWTND